ncbi:MAG: hypothetical protein ACOC2W_01925 [bacterium]
MSSQWKPGDGKPPSAGNNGNPNNTPSSQNNPFKNTLFENKNLYE